MQESNLESVTGMCVWAKFDGSISELLQQNW